eukprot:scaffold6248_cov121-Isochrysis_galbana.AAC.3
MSPTHPRPSSSAAGNPHVAARPGHGTGLLHDQRAGGGDGEAAVCGARSDPVIQRFLSGGRHRRLRRGPLAWPLRAGGPSVLGEGRREIGRRLSVARAATWGVATTSWARGSQAIRWLETQGGRAARKFGRASCILTYQYACMPRSA